MSSSTSPSRPPLALIAGPTASGKSALALALAERTGGIVINADSAQVYRDLRIVSARPSPEEEARAPHRLYGHRDGALACSAADWAQEAKAEVEAAHAAGRLPILVGGTGLYLRTLLQGIAPVPTIEPAIRDEVRSLPVAEAYTELCRADPQAAARLRATDSTRIARALEVVRATGRPLSHWQQARSGGIGEGVELRPLILLPPRDWLYARCDERFGVMLSAEGILEVQALVDRHLSPSLPVMRAIGVREIAGFVEGRLSRAEALAAGQQATRHYAKRQFTWFRHQPPPEWPRYIEPLDCGALPDALALVE